MGNQNRLFIWGLILFFYGVAGISIAISSFSNGEYAKAVVSFFGGLAIAVFGQIKINKSITSNTGER